MSGLPRALTIAGSDSGGGAGIQTDLKVFFALGCHGLSAQTALTAQNTVGVTGILEVPPEFVIAQIEAVASDIGIDAAKTGMLASAEIVEAVAKAIELYEIDRLVVDPVSVSKHRHQLLKDDALDALRGRLFPLASVITPNLYEAGLLLSRDVRTVDEMKDAARSLKGLGPAAVLVKGGHLEGSSAIDVLWNGEDMVELEGPRYDTKDTHGTGCALSAAIAARLAQGDDLRHAISFAKNFVSGAIKHGLRLGRGYGPVNPGWNLPGAAGHSPN
ncbi:MAG: bifunctional hydroxymethylpyrimidine kinase/phosphomethylpyrimidine kinase [Actinomycetota bacterium]|nr:bifunctional hydroxymethylpyrimidine kinase/phosphomethylpyrimidine kinase [Actinomycetota bacterium]